jgi:hypothetical protein
MLHTPIRYYLYEGVGYWQTLQHRQCSSRSEGVELKVQPASAGLATCSLETSGTGMPAAYRAYGDVAMWCVDPAMLPPPPPPPTRPPPSPTRPPSSPTRPPSSPTAGITHLQLRQVARYPYITAVAAPTLPMAHAGDGVSCSPGVVHLSRPRTHPSPVQPVAVAGQVPVGCWQGRWQGCWIRWSTVTHTHAAAAHVHVPR